MFLSGELGVEKPDARIYEIACTNMGISPRSAVFVDDRPEIVDAAIVLGMAARQHVDNRDTIAWVRTQLS